MNTVENQTSTTEQHKQAKSKFSSNINHNEHQSRSMEQQIFSYLLYIVLLCCLCFCLGRINVSLATLLSVWLPLLLTNVVHSLSKSHHFPNPAIHPYLKSQNREYGPTT